MRTRIIRVGNSQGIRIPKALLAEVPLGDAVEIEAEGDHLVIRPARTARSGWDEAFQSMAANGDDALLDGDESRDTEWAATEWDW
jgi:antitoxin MazE